MKQMQIPSRQRGFTLVEIAIVLVIIGLLLGGVLKGQEMIESSRVKAVVNDMNGITAAYNTYFDRYRAIPGDELTAAYTGRGWPAGVPGGNANGALEIAPADTFLNLGEQAAMWRALRASGLMAGNPSAPVGVAGLPVAGTGGTLAVAVGVMGMAGPSVCVSGLTGKQAAAIDVSVDGPLPANNVGNNLGTLRALSGATAPTAPAATTPGAAAYSETAALLWTVCRKM